MLVLGRLGPRLVTGLTGPRLLPEVTGRVVTGREPGWGSLEEACVDRGGHGANIRLDRCDQDICLLTSVITLFPLCLSPTEKSSPDPSLVLVIGRREESSWSVMVASYRVMVEHYTVTTYASQALGGGREGRGALTLWGDHRGLLLAAGAGMSPLGGESRYGRPGGLEDWRIEMFCETGGRLPVVMIYISWCTLFQGTDATVGVGFAPLGPPLLPWENRMVRGQTYTQTKSQSHRHHNY